MFFAQTDNAGKNAMWDMWADGKLYPRPYDMDTQMGLSNSGHDKHPSSSELNINLSPSKIKIEKVEKGELGKPSEVVSSWEENTKNFHTRYKSYNTTNSLFW
jgi:hypothetical protein